MTRPAESSARCRASPRTGEELWSQWDQRHQYLGEDQFGDPTRPDEIRIELITYPEAVTITSLLSSPFWQHRPHLTIEINRRIGYPCLGERRRTIPKVPQVD